MLPPLDTVIIPPGKHRAGLPPIAPLLRPHIAEMRVQFTPDSRYDDPARPPHVQKLIGFSAGPLRGGLVRAIPFLSRFENSAVWGWYWKNKRPYLVPYLRIGGKIVTGEPIAANFSRHRLTIWCRNNRFEFELDGLFYQSFPIVRTFAPWLGWRLSDYFEPVVDHTVSYRVEGRVWQ